LPPLEEELNKPLEEEQPLQQQALGRRQRQLRQLQHPLIRREDHHLRGDGDGVRGGGGDHDDDGGVCASPCSTTLYA